MKRLSIIILLLSACAFLSACDNTGTDDGIASWARAYGTAGEEVYPHAIIPAPDGGLFMLGNGSDIIKLSGEGALQWQKHFTDNLDGFYLETLAGTPDGGVVALGRGNFDADILLKLDGNGNELWKKSGSGLGLAERYVIDVDETTGSIYLVYASGQNSLVIKKDAAGNTLWGRKVTIIYGRPLFSIRATSDGGCILAQSIYTPSDSEEYTGSCLAIAIKMSAAGAVEWQKSYGPSGGTEDLAYGENYDTFVSVEEAKGGGYVLAGESQWGNSVWVVRADAAGNKQWAREISSIIRSNSNTYTMNSPIAAYSLDDGGFVFAGKSLYEFGYGVPELNGYYYRTIDEAAWIIKLSSSGAISWQKNYREPSETSTSVEEVGGLMGDISAKVQTTKNRMNMQSFAVAAGGGFAFAGFTEKYGRGGYDYMVLKMNGSGVILNTELKMSTRKATVKNLTFTVKDENIVVTDYAAEGYALPALTVTGLLYSATDI